MPALKKATAPAHGVLVDEIAAAVRLGVSRKSVQAWRLMNPPQGPPFIKFPTGAVRYDVDAIDRWLAQHTINAGEAA